MKKSILATGLLLALMTFTNIDINAQCGSGSKHSSWNTSNSQKSSSIVDLAVASNDLSTLVAAVQAAGLADVLGGEGPYTVFAPTNEAFSALPKGTVESLLKPENRDQLIKILSYHVVPGRFEASDFGSDRMLDSVEGTKVSISSNNSTVKVNNAVVVNADNRASNGVVHIIDRVILPGEL